jgi:sugar phosphate isomerase/epimerase
MAKPTLRIFRAFWGVIKQADGPWTIEHAVGKIAKAGYAGVECPIVTAMHYGIPKFRRLLDDHNLQYIAMAFTDGPVAPGRKSLLHRFVSLLITVCHRLNRF